jgi:Leucine-rich repeat (LRR) protein
MAAGMTELRLSDYNISDIRDIIYFPNVSVLDLSSNLLTDISPLVSLSNLVELNLSRNLLSTIDILIFSNSGSMLLNVAFNYISDFSLLYRSLQCRFTILGADMQGSPDESRLIVGTFFTDLDDSGIPLIIYSVQSNRPVSLTLPAGTVAAIADGYTHEYRLVTSYPSVQSVSLTMEGEGSTTSIVPELQGYLPAGAELSIPVDLPASYAIKVFDTGLRGVASVSGTTITYNSPVPFSEEVLQFEFREGDRLKGYSRIRLREGTSVNTQYHSHDKSKLLVFLRQPSSLPGKTNGELLGLTAADLSTVNQNEDWVPKVAGVTWNTDAPKRIVKIDWLEKNLSGSLDVSGCAALTNLNCGLNQLTSLDIRNTAALAELWCHGNPLTDIMVSWTVPKSINVLGSNRSLWILLHLPIVSSATLHVPAGSADLYRADDGWGLFRIVETPTGVQPVYDSNVWVSINDNILSVYSSREETVTVYSTNGAVFFQSYKNKGHATFDIKNLSQGLLIVKGSSGWIRKLFNK